MAFVTIGSYSGPPPEDPNAELRKLFTVPANQQDGLGSILKYCQTKSGFTVGSTDATLFHKILQEEFSDIITFTPYHQASGPVHLEKKVLDEMVMNDTLPQEVVEFLPKDKALREKFLLGGEKGSGTRSIIQFLNRMDDRGLTLNVDEEYWTNLGSVELVQTRRSLYFVNRGRMAEKADWLVNHLGLKDGMEDWCQRITSHGY